MKVRTNPEGPRRYEGMFLVESSVAAKDWDAVEARLKEMVEKSGGRILSSGKWDERKLSYEIRGARRATYWLCYFEAPTDAVARLRRSVVLSETALRCMILALDREEEVPEDVTSRRSTVAIGDDRDSR